MPMTKEHIIFPDREKILSKEQFTKDGTYMDPMSALFALYNIVDLDSTLELFFTYTFKYPQTF